MPPVEPEPDEVPQLQPAHMLQLLSVVCPEDAPTRAEKIMRELRLISLVCFFGEFSNCHLASRKKNGSRVLAKGLAQELKLPVHDALEPEFEVDQLQPDQNSQPLWVVSPQKQSVSFRAAQLCDFRSLCI